MRQLVHNTWYSVSEYPCEPYDIGPDVILFDTARGVIPGRGDKLCYEEDPADEYHNTQFRSYGCCGSSLNSVTHFMIMPTAPTKRDVSLEEAVAAVRYLFAKFQLATVHFPGRVNQFDTLDIYQTPLADRSLKITFKDEIGVHVLATAHIKNGSIVIPCSNDAALFVYADLVRCAQHIKQKKD